MGHHDRAAGFEAALDEFITPWRKRRDVVGGLVCGSYITGSASARSDLDVQIVLAPGTAWQERGNHVVAGFLVEYFLNPPEQLRLYFERDRERNRPVTATMFATGRVLFDQSEEVRKLRRDAEKSLRTPFPKLPAKEVEKLKYFIWDSLDNLTEAHAGDVPLAHGYHDHVHRVYSDYARFLRQSVLPAYQLYRYLSEPRYRKKYLLRAFPDLRVRTLILAALEARGRDEMMRCAEALSRHALRKMGGIEIDGWRVRFRLNQ